MNIVLVAINAKYIHSNLAVYSLKAYAEKYAKNENIEIEIAEYTINQTEDEVLRNLYERKADILAFSCYIWNLQMTKHVIENMKKVAPNVPIYMGGPEVSYNAKEFLLQNHEVEGIMRGEGEKIFANFVTAVSEENSPIPNLSNIKGMVYRSASGEIIENELESPLDMSDIPFVYKDLKRFENKIMYYETSRGCPFSCSYCLSSIDKKLRFRNLSLVKEELKFFIDNKVTQVKFVDRTFNCKKDHAIEIWKFIKEHDNGITNFHFEVAADLMTDEEIEIIKDMRPGLIQLEIGVQSVNEMTISAINRKTNLDKIREKVAKIKSFGNVHQHLDLIAGLPYEDYDSFANSFNQVYAMKPDQLQLGFLKVLYGSNMKLMSGEYGIKHLSYPPYEVLETKWISYEDVLKLKEVEEVVEIYYNSFQFSNSVIYLEKMFETPFEFYEKLGTFYKANSMNGEKHSRIARYILLRKFAELLIKEENRPIDINKFDELLTLGVYLRDNIKTRPLFAKDINNFKKEKQSIYRNEKIYEVIPAYRDYDSKQIAKMTHIEVFERIYEAQSNPKYILFDYKDRNALNSEANTIDVTNLVERFGENND